jgi:hypothetical protein
LYFSLNATVLKVEKRIHGPYKTVAPLQGLILFLATVIKALVWAFSFCPQFCGHCLQGSQPDHLQSSGSVSEVNAGSQFYVNNWACPCPLRLEVGHPPGGQVPASVALSCSGSISSSSQSWHLQDPSPRQTVSICPNSRHQGVWGPTVILATHTKQSVGSTAAMKGLGCPMCPQILKSQGRARQGAEYSQLENSSPSPPTISLCVVQ